MENTQSALGRRIRVKGSVESLVMRSLLQDVGVSKMKVFLHINAGAAQSVVERKGVGRVRHIYTHIL